MDRHHLMTVFTAVADAGGFAGAARKLGMSPAAVTRAIAELERQLGVVLLVRTTRMVRTTDAGERYAQDCRRILADIAQADEAASRAQHGLSGSLTVTASAMFGRMYCMPVIAEFLRLHPGVEVSAVFGDRVLNLAEEGVDVAVRIGELPDSALHAVRVGAVRRVLCASPAYLREHGVPRTAAQLADHALILSSGITPSAEWRLSPDGERAVQLRPRLRVSTNDAAIAAAEACVGITRLLSYQITPQLQAGTLQLVLQQLEPPALPVHVVHTQGRRAPRKVRAFVDLAVERLRANPSLR